MTKHARLGPSNKRWPECPGSLREESKYPYEGSSEAAIDGTGSHELLELCINNNVPATHYDQQIIAEGHKDRPMGWLVDLERCGRVQICLDYVSRRTNELQQQYPGCEVKIESESKSDPGLFFGRDDWWGTCDITITAYNGLTVWFVEVVDYKDGRGYVSEKWNGQLIDYLYGKIANYISSEAVADPSCISMDPEKGGFRMTIVQPKTNTPIRYMCSTDAGEPITMLDLVRVVHERNDAATATDDPNATLKAGKHCQWCKANPKRGGHCTAATDESINNVMQTLPVDQSGGGILDIITKAVADVKSLTVVELSTLADSEAGFQAAFDKVKTEIQERIETGESIPGYAMVPGRVSKVWVDDEETVAKKLKAKRLKKTEIYPAKLITPAAALKHPNLGDRQRKDVLENMISEVSGKMTLKKVSYDHKEEKSVESFLEAADQVMEQPKQEVSFF